MRQEQSMENTKNVSLAILVIALVFGGWASARAQSSKDNAVVRLDPALDALVSSEARVELVKGGFGFTEGPVWVQNGGGGCPPVSPSSGHACLGLPPAR